MPSVQPSLSSARCVIHSSCPNLKDRKGLRPGRLAPSRCFSLSSIIMSSIIMAKPHHQSQVSAAKSLFCQVRVQFTLQIEQIQGGPNDGMFVAHDAVAQLTGRQSDSANKTVKNIACPVPEPRNDQERQENRQKEENFSSRELIEGAHVSLVNFLFCTTKIFILI